MKIRQAIYSGILLAALLVLWQLLYAVLGGTVVAPPLATIHDALNIIESPDYWPHFAESLRAFLIALVIAFGLGTLGGVLIGGCRACAEILEPLLVNINSVPKVALYPVILLIFGLGMWAKVVFAVFHGIIPIMISSIGAVRNVNPVFVQYARTMHLTRWQMIRRIWIPACIPEMFSGLRLGFSLTLVGAVFGEFFASQRGFGFRLMSAVDLRDTPTIMALILILVVFAVLSNSALLAIDHRLHRRRA